MTNEHTSYDALEHVKTRMLGVCAAIAPLVVGKTEAEAERIIEDAFVKALDELAAEIEATLPEDDPEAA